MGQLQLLPEDLYDLSFREFYNKHKGFTDLLISQQRDEWERMRLQTTALVNIHLKKGKKIRPEKFMPFDWDKDEPIDRQEQIKREEAVRAMLERSGTKYKFLSSIDAKSSGRND